MTQGWRRFTWKELTTRQLNPPKFLAEKGLQISGKITRDDGKSLSKAIEVSMMLKTANEEVGFMVASADADGGYIFRDLNVQDSVRILLQAVAGKNGRNTAVLVDSLASPKIKIVSIPYNTIEFENEDLAEYLRRTREELAIEQKIRLNKTILLNEVVVKTKRENNYKGITLLYGIPNHTLQVAGNDLLIAYTNVFDMIGGRFAGVQGSGNSLTIRGSSVSFLLDGLAVSSDIIGSLPTSDVEKIDILKPGASTAIYGLRGGGGGIISVFTKRGFGNTDWKNVIPLGSLIFTKPGYYTAREFYSPNYAEDTPENLRPDYRSTVLWKPMVQTDEKGKATITFYTTDATTKLDIRLEGMSFTGKPVIGTYQLEVS